VLLNEPVQVSLQPPATPGRMLVAFWTRKKEWRAGNHSTNLLCFTLQLLGRLDVLLAERACHGSTTGGGVF
jgi:hypothetical protein